MLNSWIEETNIYFNFERILTHEYLQLKTYLQVPPTDQDHNIKTRPLL